MIQPHLYRSHAYFFQAVATFSRLAAIVCDHNDRTFRSKMPFIHIPTLSEKNHIQTKKSPSLSMEEIKVTKQVNS